MDKIVDPSLAPLTASATARVRVDSDTDGLSDSLEAGLGSYTDDTDSDIDGLSDSLEAGLGSYTDDTDSDIDGLSDSLEAGLGSYTDDPDSDTDGLSDSLEAGLGSYTDDPDSDTDGLSDSLEAGLGSYTGDPDSADPGFGSGLPGHEAGIIVIGGASVLDAYAYADPAVAEPAYVDAAAADAGVDPFGASYDPVAFVELDDVPVDAGFAADGAFFEADDASGPEVLVLEEAPSDAVADDAPAVALQVDDAYALDDYTL